MDKIKHAEALSVLIRNHKGAGKTIGFVPTMGALHDGHLSLLECCRKENDIVVASIFVNPTQFNDPNDLRNYPRDLEADLDILREHHCDMVFCPDEKEIYPEPDNRQFDLGHLDKVMEGMHRPGHFNGVAQVVTRLLDIVNPHRMYLGNKDFQQVAVIRKVLRDLNYPVEVIACPTIREHDGLAMSSRNRLLDPDQRRAAPQIFAVLKEAGKLINERSVAEIKAYVVHTLNENPGFDVEYFEVVEEATLQPLDKPDASCVGCIAVKVGPVRLIDNVHFSS